MTDRTKVLLLAVVLAGAGAAAWFLYLEEWVNGGPTASAPPPKPVAKAPAAPAPAAAKPIPVAATVPAAAPAPAPAPLVVAQAPKEPAKPMAAEPPKAEKPKPVAAKPPALAAPAPTEAAMPPKEPAVAEAPPAPVAPPETPAPMAEPREAPVVVPAARGPSIPGPRFNDLATAVLYRDPKAVDELLAFGKWPEKADGRGITPLMIAAMIGEAGMAESLLKAGANPNRPGPGGSTATSIARERSDTALLKLLQTHGGR